MKLTDVLLTILRVYWVRYKHYPSKTKLMKLAYLVDVLHARRFGHKLSNANWIYYLYGPYVKGYEKILEDNPFNIQETEIRGERTASIVSLAGEPEQNPDLDEKLIITSVVHDYGGLDLKDLLDHVYFDTEPMINAEHRMQPLDFGTVQPHEFYKVRDLKVDEKTKNQIRKEFREKIRKVRSEGNP